MRLTNRPPSPTLRSPQAPRWPEQPPPELARAASAAAAEASARLPFLLRSSELLPPPQRAEAISPLVRFLPPFPSPCFALFSLPFFSPAEADTLRPVRRVRAQVFAVRAADPSASARLARLSLLPDSSPPPSHPAAAADAAAALLSALRSHHRPLAAEAARGLLSLSACPGACAHAAAACAALTPPLPLPLRFRPPDCYLPCCLRLFVG